MLSSSSAPMPLVPNHWPCVALLAIYSRQRVTEGVAYYNRQCQLGAHKCRAATAQAGRRHRPNRQKQPAIASRERVGLRQQGVRGGRVLLVRATTNSLSEGSAVHKLNLNTAGICRPRAGGCRKTGVGVVGGVAVGSSVAGTARRGCTVPRVRRARCLGWLGEQRACQPCGLMPPPADAASRKKRWVASAVGCRRGVDGARVAGCTAHVWLAWSTVTV